MSEQQFNEYLDYRLGIYERSDITFLDEIEILGFYLKDNFPLPKEDKRKEILMTGFMEDIDEFYTKSGVGMFTAVKSVKVNK